jgi:hypothetical protein
LIEAVMDDSGGRTLTWTRITDQDEATDLLPAWLGRRLIGLHGRFGLLLATGDVMRITSIGAVHLSSDGLVLLDVSLDHGGVPDNIDLAWQPKQFLGAPLPGATAATVNLAHVVAAVEFIETAQVEPPGETDAPTAEEVVVELKRLTADDVELGQLSAELSEPE